jgi:hypothetical protein
MHDTFVALTQSSLGEKPAFLGHRRPCAASSAQKKRTTTCSACLIKLACRGQNIRHDSFNMMNLDELTSYKLSKPAQTMVQRFSTAAGEANIQPFEVSDLFLSLCCFISLAPVAMVNTTEVIKMFKNRMVCAYCVQPIYATALLCSARAFLHAERSENS